MRWIVLWVALCVPGSVIAADKYVLLHFGADWCGPCRMMDTQFTDRGVVHELAKRKIQVFHINIDKDRETTDAYQVTAVPTMILVKIVDKDKGKVLARKTGYQPALMIIQFLEPPPARD